MHISVAAVIGVLGASSLALAADTPSAGETLQDLNDQALDALNDTSSASTESKRSNGCNLFNAYARKDWYVTI